MFFSIALNEIQERRRWKPRSVLGAAIFLHIRGRDRIKDDLDGTNLPDVPAALSTAESKIRELRKESGYDYDPTLMVIVKDEAGRTVLSLPFFPGH
jgi:hypothetical protein